MADVSKITLPNGLQYTIKDATAREAITTLMNQIKQLQQAIPQYQLKYNADAGHMTVVHYKK